MYDVEKRSAVLEDAAGFARLDVHMYGPVTKWRHWGMFIHWGNKLRVRPNAAQQNGAPSSAVQECLGAERTLPPDR